MYFVRLILKYIFSDIFKCICRILCCCCKKDESETVKNKEIHFCWRVQEEFVADEKLLQKDWANQPVDTANQYDQLPRSLQALRINEYGRIRALKKRSQYHQKVKQFSTLPSYDYRLHPNLIDLFVD